MKNLVLDSSMTNMGGVFYPTGHVFALYRFGHELIVNPAPTMRCNFPICAQHRLYRVRMTL